MKPKWIIGTLGALLLLVSLSANIWLGATLRVYRYNANQGWFSYSVEGAPAYPISGLSAADIEQIVEQIEATAEGNPDNKRIMKLEVFDKQTVEVTTGRLVGPLAGGGQKFRFIMTPTGWKLDESSRMLWES